MCLSLEHETKVTCPKLFSCPAHCQVLRSTFSSGANDAFRSCTCIYLHADSIPASFLLNCCARFEVAQRQAHVFHLTVGCLVGVSFLCAVWQSWFTSSRPRVLPLACNGTRACVGSIETPVDGTDVIWERKRTRMSCRDMTHEFLVMDHGKKGALVTIHRTIVRKFRFCNKWEFFFAADS